MVYENHNHHRALIKNFWKMQITVFLYIKFLKLGACQQKQAPVKSFRVHKKNVIDFPPKYSFLSKVYLNYMTRQIICLGSDQNR